MSARQDKPLGGKKERSNKVLDNIELIGREHEMLSRGPYHPLRDKFN